MKDTPQLTLLNLGQCPESLPAKVQYVRGDAHNLPFADKSFDVVFSNSVIEHVDSRSDQMEMAKEMMRVGKSYYCQTPNYWFPVGPQFLAPIIHWLPLNVRCVLVRCFSIWGWVTKTLRKSAYEMVRSINLLDQNKMDEFFPNAQWMNERVLGLQKSLIATRLDHVSKRSEQ